MRTQPPFRRPRELGRRSWRCAGRWKQEALADGWQPLLTMGSQHRRMQNTMLQLRLRDEHVDLAEEALARK